MPNFLSSANNRGRRLGWRGLMPSSLQVQYQTRRKPSLRRASRPSTSAGLWCSRLPNAAWHHCAYPRVCRMNSCQAASTTLDGMATNWRLLRRCAIKNWRRPCSTSSVSRALSCGYCAMSLAPRKRGSGASRTNWRRRLNSQARNAKNRKTDSAALSTSAPKNMLRQGLAAYCRRENKGTASHLLQLSQAMRRSSVGLTPGSCITCLFLQAQHPALHLAGGGHGQGVHKFNLLGVLVGCQLAFYVGLQLGREFGM